MSMPRLFVNESKASRHESRLIFAVATLKFAMPREMCGKIAVDPFCERAVCTPSPNDLDNP